ncbi:uncharacterized protein [Drosophila bipectinata]|uniref:uncharacterized protein isoform X2 n=1 Tax=Drosophila bipectinata TaxID=42026 RepID=UPI0038B40B09
MKSNTRNRTVKMTVSFRMIPEATFYVYSFEGEEMRMDMKTVTFEKDFGNSIQIADQCVLLLRGGNDLSRENIFSDLGTHGTSGLIILTNARLKSDIIYEDCHDGGDIVIPARSPSSTSSETFNPIHRNHFSETCLFENLTE